MWNPRCPRTPEACARPYAPHCMLQKDQASRPGLVRMLCRAAVGACPRTPGYRRCWYVLQNALCSSVCLQKRRTESGAQPLVSDDGKIILCVNGEIYNHTKLREGLKTPYSFKTHSDCEVIIPLVSIRAVSSTTYRLTRSVTPCIVPRIWQRPLCQARRNVLLRAARRVRVALAHHRSA